MNLELNLDAAKESALRNRATVAGKSLNEFVQDVLEEELIEATAADVRMPHDQWKARLHAFVARHKPTGYPMDDSRESIYPDRT
jgi:hypothetical protein